MIKIDLYKIFKICYVSGEILIVNCKTARSALKLTIAPSLNVLKGICKNEQIHAFYVSFDNAVVTDL